LCTAPNPCTTPPSASCANDITLETYSSPGSCSVTSPGSFTCTYTPENTDCSANSKACYGGACITPSVPAPNDLVITEIMHTPSASYPNGEWFEVHNRTSTVLNLAGLTVDEVNTSATFTLPSSLVLVQPGANFVFSRSALAGENGFGASGYQWSAFALPPTLLLILSMASTEITRTSVDGMFSNTTGGAIQLSSNIPFASSRSWYWCDALALLTNGDYGTPGAANHDCGVNVTPPIDYCAVQFPQDLVIGPAVSTTIFGQLYEPNVTTRSLSGNDFYPLVETQFGYGPAGTDATTWTWSTAPFNAFYTPTGALNNDEMQATVAFSAVGSYSYGFRMRLLDPVTGTPGAYVYCGRDAIVLPSAMIGWSTATVN
jgi:hypothetical protein